MDMIEWEIAWEGVLKSMGEGVVKSILVGVTCLLCLYIMYIFI